jgi:hypothetical protein
VLVVAVLVVAVLVVAVLVVAVLVVIVPPSPFGPHQRRARDAQPAGACCHA